MNTLDIKAYYQSSLGCITQMSIEHILDVLGHTDRIRRTKKFVSMGYTIPFLFAENVNPVFFLSQLGAIPWPVDNNVCCLVDEKHLPLPNKSVDLIYIIHGFEFIHNIKSFLDECSRVLSNTGHMVIVVPNRRSLWAHNIKSPMGYGHPYTLTQLRELFASHSWSIIRYARGLYSPPYNSDFNLSVSPMLDRCCRFLGGKFSGLIGVEICKEELKPVLKKIELPSLQRRKQALNMR